MIDWTKPVRTVGGHDKVHVVATDLPGRFPILAWYPCFGQSVVLMLTASGERELFGDGIMHQVVENVPHEPVTCEVWVNVLKTREGLLMCGVPSGSRAHADSGVWERANRVGRMRITLREGVWDE